ncbi:MAG: hypothetical protein H0T73_12770, partial [Ardenticatenales bacterium]|nr:hypothetical protein [Ardenticatenales bacterium]
MRVRLFVLTLLFLLSTVMLGRPTASAPLDYDNDTDGHLSNGGFEGNFYSVGAGQVAEGWTRLNLQGNP